jgi:integrase
MRRAVDPAQMSVILRRLHRRGIHLVRAGRPGTDEVKRLLARLGGAEHLFFSLLYGTGMRLSEGLLRHPPPDGGVRHPDGAGSSWGIAA